MKSSKDQALTHLLKNKNVQTPLAARYLLAFRMSASFNIESREATDSISCPQCRKSIRFYRFSAMGDMTPHFYCSKCSNLYYSEAHHLRLQQQQPSAQMVSEIAATLPECPCGGQFVAGSNPKCPHCHVELAHQSSAVERLTDPYAILLEGASAVYPATSKRHES